jgi:hypothetical protein
VRTWRERDHPRDGRGRFARKGTVDWSDVASERLGRRGGGSSRVAGRDLLGELTEQDWREIGGVAPSPRDVNFHGGHAGDPSLAQLLARQGYDGPPEVVDADQIQQSIDRGALSLWRGVNGSQDGTKTAEQVAEQFRSGPLRAGIGAFGNGTYFGPPDSREEVQQFYGEAVIHAALSPDARTIDYSDLEAEMKRDLGFDRRQLPRDESEWTARDRVLADHGRYAVLRGYDAIFVQRFRSDEDRMGLAEIVILNRTALQVERGRP